MNIACAPLIDTAYRLTGKRYARLMSLTSFSPGLLRVPVVYLIFHSSVITMSQKHSLIKYGYLDP
jgi:hypothetical protein